MTLKNPNNLTNKNPRIFCIGEALLDIIFTEDQPRHANPGGSMLNSAVSLGRMGHEVYMISDLGSDHPGNLIADFLEKNGVSTRYIRRYEHGKTALALAFLDERRNAGYTFYKDFPEDRFPVDLPSIEPGDFVLFGSFYSITPNIHQLLRNFIRNAAEQGAFILYDPNFRRPHLPDLEQLRPMILENISMAHLVKGSDEDFELIFGAGDFKSAYDSVVQAGCRHLVYTRSSKSVEAMIDGKYYEIPVPAIIPASTIGAGDAFNAGMIHQLVLDGSLPFSDFTHVIETAIGFAGEVCMMMGNYLRGKML